MVDDYFSENLKSVVGGGNSQEIVLDEETVAKIVEALSNQTSSIRSEKQLAQTILHEAQHKPGYASTLL